MWIDKHGIEWTSKEDMEWFIKRGSRRAVMLSLPLQLRLKALAKKKGFTLKDYIDMVVETHLGCTENTGRSFIDPLLVLMKYQKRRKKH